MDEMKLKLGSRWMRGIVGKLISTMIKKQTGYDIKILLGDLDIVMLDGTTTVKANVEANIDKEEFTKIIKSIGLD